MRRHSPARKCRAAETPSQATTPAVETKWGWQPCIEQGICAVPSALLRSATGLGLCASEGWLLVQLLDMKWSSGLSSLTEVERRCGATPDDLMDALRSLEERGFLKLHARGGGASPVKGRGRNGARPSPASSGHSTGQVTGSLEIDLSPLLEALNDFVMRDGDLSIGFVRLSSVKLSEPGDESGEIG